MHTYVSIEPKKEDQELEEQVVAGVSGLAAALRFFCMVLPFPVRLCTVLQAGRAGAGGSSGGGAGSGMGESSS